MDVFFSGIFLILGAIPLCIVGILVRITSKGPALFKQKRLGMNGKVFEIYKFRSMVVGAEKQGSGVYDSWSQIFRNHLQYCRNCKSQ